MDKSKKLLIVESPGKIKKISKILGAGWIVKASCGHIRELSNQGEDSLGFSFEGNKVNCSYQPKDSRAKDTIEQLKTAAKSASEVYLATDPDREGETIAWHLKEVLNLKNPQRVVYSEITEAAIKAAIAKPRTLDVNLVNAGLCRDCLDKLVGYKGSPLIWTLNNGAKSMGRVQSAALHLVCEREREIINFKPTNYWSVFVKYAENFQAFYKGGLAEKEAEEVAVEDEAADDSENSKENSKESSRVLSQEDAERLVSIASTSPHKVLSIVGRSTKKQPPPALSTSSLQQVAGAKYKISPDTTMQLAQKLYEAGLITYMRTDSVTLSADFCDAARSWLQENDPENVPENTAKHKNSPKAQEAHEAIRPTDVTKTPSNVAAEVDSNQARIYEIIWQRAVASQCQSAVIQKTIITTVSRNITWQARGQVFEFAGYAKYWDNLGKDSTLPALKEDQSLTLQSANHEKKQTQPQARFSEAKLVQQMERKGIGRPSTYSPTIATIKARGYVQLTKDTLQPTSMGLDVDDFLMKALPDMIKSDFTANMESSLDKIASGAEDWQEFITRWNSIYFAPALAQARDIVGARPVTTYKTDSSITSSKPSTKSSSKTKTSQKGGAKKAENKVTKFPCPVCKTPLETYTYIKDGQEKTMLRCSDAEARRNPDHKEAVYFKTQNGWWSPKFGEFKV